MSVRGLNVARPVRRWQWVVLGISAALMAALVFISIWAHVGSSSTSTQNEVGVFVGFPTALLGLALVVIARPRGRPLVSVALAMGYAMAALACLSALPGWD